jgi:hypothetical protein
LQSIFSLAAALPQPSFLCSVAPPQPSFQPWRAQAPLSSSARFGLQAACAHGSALPTLLSASLLTAPSPAVLCLVLSQPCLSYRKCLAANSCAPMVAELSGSIPSSPLCLDLASPLTSLIRATSSLLVHAARPVYARCSLLASVQNHASSCAELCSRASSNSSCVTRPSTSCCALGRAQPSRITPSIFGTLTHISTDPVSSRVRVIDFVVVRASQEIPRIG